MSDTIEEEAKLEAEELAGARARTDAAFVALAGMVAKRHRTAALAVQQRVHHERRLVDMMLRARRHLERVIAVKDTTIAALKSNADGWREIARRHGADVDDEKPQRSN
jgi:hypothetical protein